jgi:transcription antitermination factor NusG
MEQVYPWFALRVKPRWEKEVSRNLRCKGCAELLPLYTRQAQWSDRVKRVELPLFPGYLFASFDPGRPLHVKTTPGVLSIVSFGKCPLPLDQAEVEAIKAVMHSGLHPEPWKYPQLGDRVRVTAGPLKGIEGLVCTTENTHRLVLSVTLLQRAIAVEVEPQWVEVSQFGTETARALHGDPTFPAVRNNEIR